MFMNAHLIDTFLPCVDGVDICQRVRDQCRERVSKHLLRLPEVVQKVEVSHLHAGQITHGRDFSLGRFGLFAELALFISDQSGAVVLRGGNNQDVVFVHTLGVVLVVADAYLFLDFHGSLENVIAHVQATDVLTFEPCGAIGGFVTHLFKGDRRNRQPLGLYLTCQPVPQTGKLGEWVVVPRVEDG